MNPIISALGPTPAARARLELKSTANGPHVGHERALGEGLEQREDALHLPLGDESPGVPSMGQAVELQAEEARLFNASVHRQTHLRAADMQCSATLIERPRPVGGSRILPLKCTAVPGERKPGR